MRILPNEFVLRADRAPYCGPERLYVSWPALLALAPFLTLWCAGLSVYLSGAACLRLLKSVFASRR